MEDLEKSPWYFFNIEYNESSSQYILTISEVPEISSFVDDLDELMINIVGEQQVTMKGSPLLLEDLLQEQSLQFKDYSTLDMSKPMSEQDYTNLTLRIIFHDIDDNGKLSVGDELILSTVNAETGLPVQYSDYIVHLSDLEGEWVSRGDKLVDLGEYHPVEGGGGTGKEP